MAMIVYLSLLIHFSLISAQSWSRYLKLDENYEVWWSMNDDSVTFQVEVATTGWVGFGVSPNGGMAGADVVIGWIDNGNAVFQDRHAEGKFLPAIDEQQDWKLLWHEKNDTHTKFRFERLLETCDEQDMIITDATTRLIFAYNSQLPSSETAVTYHGTSTRGTKNVFLKEETQKKLPERPEDLRYWEVRAPSVEITEESDTEYFCSFFRTPVDKKHHLIQFDAVITPGNERIVHHMLLYECTGATNETISKYSDKEYHRCYTEEQIPKFAFCLTVYLGWAVGGESFVLPENTGFPFSTTENEWYMLEIHYDNPGGKRVIDNSGLRMTYTPVLRQYDSSILSTGNLWFPCMVIPPKQKEFVMSAHVASSCLSQRVPPEGIKVYAVLFHSHVIGKRMVLRHFRGDTELEPIIEDRNYDFDLQQFRHLSKIHTVLPNDHLILECTYDSSKRSKVTFGGISTREEMCLAFLIHYPKISLAIAASCPHPRNFLLQLGAKKISEEETFLISPFTGRNESYFDFLNSYSWTENSVDVLQDAMTFAPQLNMCTDRGWKLVPTFVLSTYPKVNARYQEPSKCTSKRKHPKLLTRKRTRIVNTSTKISKQESENENQGEQQTSDKVVIPYSLIDDLFS